MIHIRRIIYNVKKSQYMGNNNEHNIHMKMNNSHYKKQRKHKLAMKMFLVIRRINNRIVKKNTNKNKRINKNTNQTRKI